MTQNCNNWLNNNFSHYFFDYFNLPFNCIIKDKNANLEPDKAKTKFRARFNNYKSAHRSYRKKRKYHSSAFMKIMGNTVIMELMIGNSH